MKKLKPTDAFFSGDKILYIDSEGRIQQGESLPEGITLGYDVPDIDDKSYLIETSEGAFIVNYGPAPDLIPLTVIITDPDDTGTDTIAIDSGPGFVVDFDTTIVEGDFSTITLSGDTYGSVPNGNLTFTIENGSSTNSQLTVQYPDFIFNEDEVVTLTIPVGGVVGDGGEQLSAPVVVTGIAAVILPF